MHPSSRCAGPAAAFNTHLWAPCSHHSHSRASSLCHSLACVAPVIRSSRKLCASLGSCSQLRAANCCVRRLRGDLSATLSADCPAQKSQLHAHAASPALPTQLPSPERRAKMSLLHTHSALFTRDAAAAQMVPSPPPLESRRGLRTARHRTPRPDTLRPQYHQHNRAGNTYSHAYHSITTSTAVGGLWAAARHTLPTTCSAPPLITISLLLHSTCATGQRNAPAELATPTDAATAQNARKHALPSSTPPPS
jgi:hypothetical protein